LNQEFKRFISSNENQAGHQLIEYFRLNKIAKLIRRIGFATQNYKLVEKMDAQLMQYFSTDEDFVKQLIEQRIAWGLYGSARDIIEQISKDKQVKYMTQLSGINKEDIFSFERALGVAISSKDFEQIKSLSILGNKQNEILTVAQQWAKAGFYIEAVQWSQTYLSKDNYQNLCAQVIKIIQGEPKSLIVEHGRTTGTLSEFLLQLENITGELVFSDTQLFNMLNIKYELSLLDDHYFPLYLTAYMAKRASSRKVAAGLLLNIRMLFSLETSQLHRFTLVAPMWMKIIAEPLTQEFSKQVSDLLLELMAKETLLNEHSMDLMTNVIITFEDIHPSNIEQVKRVSDYLYAKSAQVMDYFKLARLLKSGKVDAAVDEFIKLRLELDDLASGGDPKYDFLWNLDHLFVPKYNDVIKHRFDAIEPKELKPEWVALRFSLFYDFGIPADLDYMERLINKYPKNQEYLRTLYFAYQKKGRSADALRIMKLLFAQKPDKLIHRAALFGNFLKLHRFSEALALAENDFEGMLKQGFFAKLEKQEIKTLGVRPFLTSLNLSGKTDKFKNLSLYNGREISFLEAVSKENQPESRKSLRTIWQDAKRVPEVGQAFTVGPLTRNNIVELEFSQPENIGSVFTQLKQSSKVFDELVKFDFAATEFEHYIRALDTNQKGELYKLYPYLIKAYKENGSLKDKWKPLNKRVIDNKASGEDYSFWLTFLIEGDIQISADTVNILDRNFLIQHLLSEYQLRSMARLYSKLDNMSKATEVYRLLLLRSLVYKKKANVFTAGVVHHENVFTALTFVDEIKQHLNREQQIELTKEVIYFVKPDVKAGKSYQEYYQRFIIKAWGKISPANEALLEIAKVIDITTQEQSAGYFLDLAKMYFKANDKKQALILFKKYLRNKNTTPNDLVFDSRGWQKKLVSDKYALMLGIIPSSSITTEDDPLLPTDMQDLFPAEFENVNWLKHAAILLNQWAQKDIDGVEILPYMLFIVHQLHKVGAIETVKPIMVNISTLLLNEDIVSSKLALLAIAVSDQVEEELSLVVMQKFLRNGWLLPNFIGAVIRRTYETEGAVVALKFGEKTLEQTHDDSLLETLILMAKETGNDIKLKQWQKIQNTEKQAHKYLTEVLQ